MAIKFFNIRSKEVLVAETEPQISALWSSSDRSPNITQGQDFGWRLAPEVVVEMKHIKQDKNILAQIAAQTMRSLEDVGEPEILEYISAKYSEENAPIAQDGDYTDEYESEIRRLELERSQTVAPINASTPEQKESLAELRERVELAERLAKAQAAITNPVPTSTDETVTTTTTEVPTTTTTTTKPPTTTTTTTKKQ